MSVLDIIGLAIAGGTLIAWCVLTEPSKAWSHLR